MCLSDGPPARSCGTFTGRMPGLSCRTSIRCCAEPERTIDRRSFTFRRELRPALHRSPKPPLRNAVYMGARRALEIARGRRHRLGTLKRGETQSGMATAQTAASLALAQTIGIVEVAFLAASAGVVRAVPIAGVRFGHSTSRQRGGRRPPPRKDLAPDG
jgi:hypothetical protein